MIMGKSELSTADFSHMCVKNMGRPGCKDKNVMYDSLVHLHGMW